MGLYNWIAHSISIIKRCIGTVPTKIFVRSAKIRVESEATTGVDIHLVMNIFNYLTPEIITNGVSQKKSSEIIFDLSDYLRKSLRWSAPRAITVAEECELLENYIRLLTNPRGWTLKMSIGFPSRLKDHKITAHSICQIANVLMQGLYADVGGLWNMTTYISAPARKQLQIEMILQSNFYSMNHKMKDVDRELKRLCSVMSNNNSMWSCETFAIHGAYTAARVCIVSQTC